MSFFDDIANIRNDFSEIENEFKTVIEDTSGVIEEASADIGGSFDELKNIGQDFNSEVQNDAEA